jgi:hypothetical protein
MIFHNIWTDTSSIRQHHAGNVYTVTYGVKPDMFTCLDDFRGQSAAWLLANKQMLQEGLEQLSQETTWHFGPSIQQSQWKGRGSRLIVPYKARGYQLQIGFDAEGLEMCFQKGFIWGRDGYGLRDYPHTDTRIPQIIGFTKRTSVVTVLHIDIHREHVDTGLIDHMLKYGRVDFHLSVCTRLRKFSVRLHEDCDDHDPPHERWVRRLFDFKFDPEERYFEGLQKELSRIGRILIGNGKETVMSFGTYMAQYEKLEKDGGIARWDYVIEK